MIDVSFQGAKLTLTNSMIKGNIVLEFDSEGTPVEFPDLETCGYSMTMNGELVTWTKPSPIQFRITVVPGSTSDASLRKLLYAGHVGGNKGDAISQETVHISTAVLEVPAISTNGVIDGPGKQKFKFSRGRLTGGNPAIGSNAEGRMTSRTYSFVFESVTAE